KATKAQQAEGQAQAAAKEEKTARNRAEWLLHAGRISLSWQAWNSGNVDLACYYLDLCQPDYRGWEHDYLYTLFHSNQRTFGKPTTVERPRGVTSVAVSREGKHIVSGNHDGTVRVWDAETGLEILTL